MTIRATSCHIIDHDRTLLLRKSEGLFGGGKWDPPGGKMLPGETPQACVVREILEETGLELGRTEQHGTLNYYKDDQRSTPDWIVYLFSTTQFKGSLTESREGILRWFKRNEIPIDNMWEDYRYWYKDLLKGKKMEGEFYFSGNFEKLTNYDLRIE